MNLIEEFGELHMRIILTAAFGLSELHKARLPYIENG